MKYAVLIADVIQSRQTPRLRTLLTEKLGLVTRADLGDKRIRLPYAVTAGDEFQVIPSRIEFIPELIFDLRRKMRPFRLRIGVGIGEINGQIRVPVNRMSGTAFVFAREAIENVKRGSLHEYPALTAFRSARKPFDRIANLVYGLNDTLLLEITEPQWRTIDAYLRRKTVDRAARSLQLAKSTASRSLKRAGYWQLRNVAVTMTAIFGDEWN